MHSAPVWLLQMARREMRSSWRRLVFFFICIAIGVGSIVALRSIIRNFNHVFTSDARAILGSDIQIESNRPWKEATLTKIRSLTESRIEARAQTIEAATMLRPADASKPGAMMVELKGIEAPYPFYGKITVDGKPFSHALLSDRGAVAAQTVYERLDLQPGDRVKIGDSFFQLRGVLDSEPGSSGFRFAPRVLLHRTDLEEAGVSGFGSRARRRLELKLPENRVEPLLKKLRSELKADFVRFRSYKQSQERLDNQFTRAENFLSLTGLVILVLGGIGVSSVTRVFIEQKKKSIAVLKCLGASARNIIASYLLQMLTLGAIGSIVGVLLAKITLVLLASYYRATLPPQMSYNLQNSAILQGLAFGLMVTLLFAVVPLLRIRRIKPNVLLREETEPRASGMDRVQWITAGVVTIGLILLSSWQAGSFEVGLYFLGGLTGCALLLYLAAALLMRILRGLRPVANFSVRHAISGLYRPGNQTKVAIISIGLGTFFIVAIYSLQVNLLREMSLEQRSNLPNMYLIDIQKDQRQGVEAIIESFTQQPARLIPTVRSRIAAINGRPVDPESEEYKKDRRRLGFEYTMTYRPELDTNETILKGKFWEPTPSDVPEVSIEESLDGIMGLDVGGTITFDILGRRIRTKVTSIRRVDWQNARTGFYVVFRPGTLEDAPNVYIAAVDAPTGEPQRSQFQRRIIDSYPNVTAIDVANIIESLSRILNNVTLAVSFIAAFVLLSGVLILVGSIAMTKFQRIYEAAVLKTLGAKRKLILGILFTEHGLLGTVAGLIGSSLGLVLAYLVCREVFEIDWLFSAPLFAAGVAATVLLAVLVGTMASIDVLNKKPLTVLRSQ